MVGWWDSANHIITHLSEHLFYGPSFFTIFFLSSFFLFFRGRCHSIARSSLAVGYYWACSEALRGSSAAIFFLTQISPGTTVEELFRHVNNFYAANLQRHHNVSELLGKNQPDVEVQVEHTGSGNGGSDKASDFWGIPNVKEEFQEYIWGLLRQEKDFIVGRQNEAGDMSLKEIVEAMKAKGGGGAPASLRVYATEERRWKTLTGHGPDPKKVGLPFPLLNPFS